MLAWSMFISIVIPKECSMFGQTIRYSHLIAVYKKNLLTDRLSVRTSNDGESYNSFSDVKAATSIEARMCFCLCETHMKAQINR